MLAGVLMVVLAERTGWRDGILGRRWLLLAELMAWWAVFAVGAACVLRLPRRTALLLVVVVGVALRLAVLTDKAPLSDDLYRYAWDGRVQASGTDPYRYPPSAQELRDLRREADGGTWLWNDPACAGQGEGPGERFVGDCTWINRGLQRTIYPPVAQAWFLALHAVGLPALRDLGYMLAGLAADLALCGLLWWLLHRRGDDERWLVLYAWAPSGPVEAVQNAHVDGLATLLLVAGVVWLARRPLVGTLAVGLAALVKLYPLVVAPLVLRHARWRGPLLLVALAAAVYAPHVAAVGLDVVGFLPGYLEQEQYATGERFLLVPLVGTAGTLVGAAVLGATGLWAWLRPRGTTPRAETARTEESALVLLGVLLLVSAPVQTWYGLGVVALATLRRRPEWLAVCAAGYPLYLSAILRYPVDVEIGRASYATALLVVVLTTLWRVVRRPSARQAPQTSPLRVP